MSVILLLIAALAAGNVEVGGVCARKADLLFIVDGSANVCGSNETCALWDNNLQFIQRVADSFTIGPDDTRVALVKYGKVATTHWNLEGYTDRTSLMPAIASVPFPGDEFDQIETAQVVLTEVFDPLFGDRVLVQNVAVVITNGMPNYRPWMTGLVSHIFQKTGVVFFVVGVKPECDNKTAEYIASPTKLPNTNTYFFADGYALIDNVREALVEQICAMLEACAASPLGKCTGL